MQSFPSNPLRITFQNGSCRETSRIAATVARGDNLVVMTDVTPFHPQDFQWPDQPADRGILRTADGRSFAVEDAVFASVSPTGIIFVDGEIPVKKQDSAWRFCVGHVIRDKDLSCERGEEVALSVDEELRFSLSRAHSAAHLMALALDRSLAPHWRKEAKNDALGSPDFDKFAMAASTIGPLSCRDRYRIGRSLRKRGFSGDGLRQNLAGHEGEINEILAAWLADDTPISLRSEGEDLASFRYFSTTLEGHPVEMPCGGTHVKSFFEIGRVSVSLSMPDEETLVIDTSVK